MKYKIKHVFWIILILLLSTTLFASYFSRVSHAHPQDIFEKYILSPIPKQCRAFDCRITNYFPGRTVWVVFDEYNDEWLFLVEKLKLSEVSKRNLKFASGKTPDDTGFEGYLDDADYQTLEDEHGGTFLVRKMKEKSVRVVFFKRF